MTTHKEANRRYSQAHCETCRNLGEKYCPNKQPHKKQEEELREKMKQELDAFAVQVVDYSTGMSDEYTDTVQLTDRLLSLIHSYANERVIDELRKLRDKPLCYADHDMDSEIDFIDGQAHARDHIVERLTELEKNNE